MIKKNNNTINEWYFNDAELIKVYKNGAICYYKIVQGATPSQEPCFAVVNDITQYSDTEFVDVYDKATEKWYKLNNLDQYEEYGVYGSGRTITYYEGKLTIDNGYEYEWDGSEWDNLGEVSGSTQHDYTKDYLTFEPISSAVTYSHGMKDFQYSLDSGQTWITCTTADTVTVNVGQVLLLKGNFGDSSDVDTNRFTANGGTWKAYGNLLSLIYGDNFASASTTLSNNGLMWAFYHCSNLVDIDNLTIPVTAISASRAFRGTFRDCGFSTVPDFLFYAQITGGTHTFMGTFEDCSNLVKAPILPSTSVPSWGYYAMFNNCSSLSEVTCLATNPRNSNNTTLWLNGVSSSGTFYKAINVNWGRGTNGIPNNWSVSEIVNPPVPPSPTVYIYPKNYTEKDEPENNVVFEDMEEALAYECPWVGMKAYIAGDKYTFTSGYTWELVPSRLPAGYTEVEYIENSNNSFAYIDTGFKPNQDTRIVTTMQMVNASDYGRFIGAGSYNSSNAMQFDYEVGYSGTLHISWGHIASWTTYSNCIGDYNIHEYDWDKNYFYRDKGETNQFSASTTYTAFQCTDNLGIFAYIVNGSTNSDTKEHLYGRMYSFQMYDNGTLIRDLVPCVRDSDNIAGAYDLVNNVFYGSGNNNRFVAGDPV